jgi:hypothetical protein
MRSHAYSHGESGSGIMSPLGSFPGDSYESALRDPKRAGPLVAFREATMRTLAERFWEKVDKSGDCWLWTASLSGNGYGHISVSLGKFRAAHRVAWEMENGPIPAGMYLCHRCDTPRCVRPSHMFVGTPSDNMKDCAAKGRCVAIGQRRKTVCKRGHPLDGPTVRVEMTGNGRKHRRCRICSSLIRKLSRQTNGDAVRDSERAGYWRNPDRRREWARKYRMQRAAIRARGKEDRHE